MENRAENDWRADPRLHTMDSKKIALLASFADELSSTPEQQKMTAFLSLNKKLNECGLSFSPKERDLLFQILTENLTPEDRKRALMIRQLTGRFRTNMQLSVRKISADKQGL